MSNYCAIDFSSNSNLCKDNSDVITKYSEDVKSINDVTPCKEVWDCTDRGSCNMGNGSYQKWLNSQRDLRKE